IVCPPGKDIRPTSSKIRQAIFNILYSMDFDMRQALVLELFSGTGIVSIEAISRGAKKAVIVDNSHKANLFAEKNIHNLGMEDKINIIKQDAMEYVKNADISDVNLIFIDPPYRYEKYSELIESIFLKISNDAIVMAESDKIILNEDNEIGARIIKIKNWGKTFITFMKKKRTN
ncbi:MAG: RsmD family RNA methyltransferase, partial [Proteobacteria bacterium]|nr:RsmD family RNA methyltransferase [Pseudomonadota bacterium]